MKKITILTLTILLTLSSNIMAYNPNSFEDEETLTVNGKRPKVDIELSELTVNIEADDFVDGIANVVVPIDNVGNKAVDLSVIVGQIPVDLTVSALLDTDVLSKGESTNSNISVELGEMQEAEDFTFTITVKAEMR